MPLLDSQNTERIYAVMKNTYSIAQRNALVEEHLSCIDEVMRRERRLIRSAGLDKDDVYQQLAIRLIKAVGSFDPAKGELKAHIMAQLRYELLDCLSAYRMYGITNAPKDLGEKIISFEAYRNRAVEREMALAA